MGGKKVRKPNNARKEKRGRNLLKPEEKDEEPNEEEPE